MNEEELNSKWNIHKVVDQAVRGALNYNESSRQSAKDIAVLQETYKLFMEQNKEEHKALLESITEFHLASKESMKELNDKLDNALSQKANKWVEKVMIWLFVSVSTGVLGYLGLQLIKLIELK